MTAFDMSLVQCGAPISRTTPSAPADDPLAQLEKLVSLRDRGILSAEEFDRKKAELMDRI